MKKIFALILSATLVLGTMMPVLALENSDTINISAESIESIMTGNSSNMALAKNNFDKSSQTYSTALSDYNKLKKQYEALELTSPAAWSQASSLSNQLDGLRTSLNSAKFNLDSAKLIYIQQVQRFVLASKQQYFSYLSALAQNQISRNTVSSQQLQLKSLQGKLLSGYASKKQIDTLSSQISDLKISLANQEEQAAVLLSKLRSAMGIPEAALVIVEPVNSFDFSAISAIVPDDDLDDVLANSVDIKAKEISLQSIKTTAASSNDPTKYRYDITAAELALTQTREQVKLDFQDQYLALKNGYDALQIRLSKLSTVHVDLAAMELRFKLGFASKKQLQDINLEATNQDLQILSDQQDLYASHLRYISAKQGN